MKNILEAGMERNPVGYGLQDFVRINALYSSGKVNSYEDMLVIKAHIVSSNEDWSLVSQYRPSKLPLITQSCWIWTPILSIMSLSILPLVSIDLMTSWLARLSSHKFLTARTTHWVIKGLRPSACEQSNRSSIPLFSRTWNIQTNKIIPRSCTCSNVL